MKNKILNHIKKAAAIILIVITLGLSNLIKKLIKSIKEKGGK